jgi:hypothetical protein
MANDTDLKYAGISVIDILELTPAMGNSVSILPMLVNLVVHEDIFSPVLTGSITIHDAYGLFNHLPISGNETINLKFHSYGYDKNNNAINFIHRTFDVVKVSNVSQATDHAKNYTLTFASPELKLNNTIKISASYQNQSISKIVSSIMTGVYDVDYTLSPQPSPMGLGFPTTSSMTITVAASDDNHLPLLTTDNIETDTKIFSADQDVELFVEKTKGDEACITIPYMKPFDAIRWLSRRAIRNQIPVNSGQYGLDPYDSTNFLFFENKRGYQFVSLTSLFEDNGNKKKSILRMGSALSNVDRNWNVDVIEKLSIQRCYDILGNISAGVYSSKLSTYELSTGEVKDIDYNYLDTFYQNTSIDGAPGTTPSNYPTIFLDEQDQNPLTTKPLSKRMLLPVSHIRDRDGITSGYTSRFNEPDATPLVGAEQYLQNRISQLAKLADFRVKANVPANSKHKVGDIVELDLSMWGISPIDTHQSDIQIKTNKYYSGNYLITAITHVISNTAYEMQLELVKDSLKARIG